MALQIPIETLDVPPRLRKLLTEAGFTDTNELKNESIVALSQELQVSRKDALSIRNAVQQLSAVVLQTVVETLPIERQRLSLATMCETMDLMLGGAGISTGSLTELCGAPGLGKTQLSMQLALNAQIPAELGGLDGCCIYIDTEGSFMPQRAHAIAGHLLAHLQAVKPNIVEAWTTESMLSRITVYRVHDYVEQLAIWHLLPSLVESSKVRLIVVDSVAFHFRQNFTDMGLRIRLLNGCCQQLVSLAREHNLAVVLINQMTTKVGSHDTAHLVPALGESWAHACTTRIILSWQAGKRCATLYKSPTMKEATIEYSIKEEGIRDAEEQGDQQSLVSGQPAAKRASRT